MRERCAKNARQLSLGDLLQFAPELIGCEDSLLVSVDGIETTILHLWRATDGRCRPKIDISGNIEWATITRKQRDR